MAQFLNFPVSCCLKQFSSTLALYQFIKLKPTNCSGKGMKEMNEQWKI
jgi:hypothetical protein